MTPKELAAAIRKGHSMIGETSILWLANGCGCALGAAWVGSGRSEIEWGDKRRLLDGSFPCLFVEAFGNQKLLQEVSHRHHNGTPRLAIADWLDTLPDETPLPAKVERESDADYATRMLRQITETVPA